MPRLARLLTVLALLVFASLAWAAVASAIAVGTVAVGTMVPKGGGTVTSSPSGINCTDPTGYDNSCYIYVPVGTTVTLIAQGNKNGDKVSPPVGYMLGSWSAGPGFSSACTTVTSTTCTFTVQQQTLLAANFVVDPSYNTWPDCYAYNNPQANDARYCTDNCAVGSNLKGNANLYWSIGVAGADYGRGACEAKMRSGELSIGGYKSHSHTFGDSEGKFVPVGACFWRSSSAVGPTAAFTVWSSTISAYNSVGDTRNWSFGVHFKANNIDPYPTAAGFKTDPYCETHGGCLEDNPCPSSDLQSTGPMRREQPLGLAPPPPFDGLALLERGFLAHESASPAAPRAGQVAKDDPGIRVVDRDVRRAGRYTLDCPAGTAMLHADTATFDTAKRDIVEPYVHHTLRRAFFTVRRLDRGQNIDLQVVCRSSLSRTHTSKTGHIRGSILAETHRSSNRNQHIHAGGGADTIHADHPGAHITAGTGNDRVIVTASRVAVMGGPGNDRIEAKTAGKALIEGGSGRDTLIVHRGTTVVNAEDGEGGDTIICDAGSKATVVKDKGDRVQGPCRIVHGA